MSNLFSSLRTYGGKWNLKSRRAFEQEEIDMVQDATVVESDYGLSCCFTMVSGVCSYIPMSNTANVKVGDTLDLTKASVLTLSKIGELDITRIDY